MFEGLKTFIDFVGGAIKHDIVSEVKAVAVRSELRLHAFRAYVVEGGARTTPLGETHVRGKGALNNAINIKVDRAARGEVIKEFTDVFRKSEVA